MSCPPTPPIDYASEESACKMETSSSSQSSSSSSAAGASAVSVASCAHEKTARSHSVSKGKRSNKKRLCPCEGSGDACEAAGLVGGEEKGEKAKVTSASLKAGFEKAVDLLKDKASGAHVTAESEAHCSRDTPCSMCSYVMLYVGVDRIKQHFPCLPLHQAIMAFFFRFGRYPGEDGKGNMKWDPSGDPLFQPAKGGGYKVPPVVCQSSSGGLTPWWMVHEKEGPCCEAEEDELDDYNKQESALFGKFDEEDEFDDRILNCDDGCCCDECKDTRQRFGHARHKRGLMEQLNDDDDCPVP